MIWILSILLIPCIPYIREHFDSEINKIETHDFTLAHNKKDFEKRVKECLKLSGGKRMGAGDAPRSDAERPGRSAARLGTWTDAD